MRIICKLSYEVQGVENIGAQPGIVFAKHQSTWETLTLNFWFTPQSWVVKRELLWAPIFGWGMYMMNPIALDRGAGKKAIEQLVEQGRERLEKGRWIIIFPEGTRIAPGKKGRYRIGGAILAERTGYAVTPVAHNAGEFWPRRQFIKKPGVIQVRIGRAYRKQKQNGATDTVRGRTLDRIGDGQHHHAATARLRKKSGYLIPGTFCSRRPGWTPTAR